MPESLATPYRLGVVWTLAAVHATLAMMHPFGFASNAKLLCDQSSFPVTDDDSNVVEDEDFDQPHDGNGLLKLQLGQITQ
jgi:hypothetical protein